MENYYVNLIYMDNIVLILAGGLGKRMNSELPKVLHLLKKLNIIYKYFFLHKLHSYYQNNLSLIKDYCLENLKFLKFFYFLLGVFYLN